MTSFARAKGSKASNEKAPEDGTPWEVMKETLMSAKKESEDAKKRQEAEQQSIENYENFLKERKTQKQPSSWCDFPEANNDSKKNAKNLKKNKQRLENSLDSKNTSEINKVEQANGNVSETTKKQNKKKKQKFENSPLNFNEKVINHVMEGESNNSERPKNKKNKKRNTEQEPGSETTCNVQGRPFQCLSCPAAFTRKYDLKIHTRTHTDERPYQCNICLKRFRQISTLNIHNRTHSGRSFQCLSCPAAFTSKQNLEIHTRTHTGERPYHCDVCLKRFVQKSTLLTHKRTHTGDRPFFECDVCYKRFSREATLKIHKRIHTGERYACDICQKRFAVKSSVTAHRWSHAADKPVNCDRCSMTFTSKAQFALHIRTHYKCSVCGRTFVLNSSLKRHHNHAHRETHSNVSANGIGLGAPTPANTTANYDSSACDLERDQAQTARRSIISSQGKVIRWSEEERCFIWSHAADKPVNCDRCSMTFTSKAQFALHICMHYECSVCGRAYLRKSSVTRHQHRAHRAHRETHSNVSANSIGLGAPTPANTTANYDSSACDLERDQAQTARRSIIPSHGKVIRWSEEERCFIHQHRAHRETHSNVSANSIGLGAPTPANTTANYDSSACDLERDQAQTARRSIIPSHGKVIRWSEAERCFIWSHAADKPVNCDHCSMTFTSKAQFALHIRTHYKCSVCGRTYLRNSSLKRHHNHAHRETHSNVSANGIGLGAPTPANTAANYGR